MRKTWETEGQMAKRTKHFTEVICTQGAQGFVEGDIYAMGEATNNALYILTDNEDGDPVNFAVYCVGDVLLPAFGEKDWYTDRCPVFEVIK